MRPSTTEQDNESVRENDSNDNNGTNRAATTEDNSASPMDEDESAYQPRDQPRDPPADQRNVNVFTRTGTCSIPARSLRLPVLPKSLPGMGAPRRLRNGVSPEERMQHMNMVIDEALNIIHGKYDRKPTFPLRQ